MKSIRIKSIALYTSMIAAVIGLIQPITSNADSGIPSGTTVVYATEKPSDSMPFCDDARLPIHVFCVNLDSQTVPRYEIIKDRSVDIANMIVERIFTSR